MIEFLDEEINNINETIGMDITFQLLKMTAKLDLIEDILHKICITNDIKFKDENDNVISYNDFALKIFKENLLDEINNLKK